MRYLSIAAVLFSATCNSTPPVIVVPTTPVEKKLWNTPEEQARFMLKMTHHLVAPIRDECIDRVLEKLKRGETKQTAIHPEFLELGFSPLMAQKAPPSDRPIRPAPAAPAAPAVGDICQASLASCGTCHLPRKNNCDYRLKIKDKGEFTGRVIADGEKIKFRLDGDDAKVSEIEPRDIEHATWLNGGDDITTWWNFKKLNRKSRIVKKMMSLAAKNDVGCTNCHLQHGNFKLNETGKHFDQTGEIKRVVSLENFLK